MDVNKKICPNCSQLYSISNLSSSKQKTNLPLFLQCGHSMCENCILNIIKCSEPIECKVCQLECEFKPSDSATVIENPAKLRDFFPVNMYLVGELTVSLISDSKTPKAHDHFADIKAILKGDTAQGQCVECRITTNKICRQCSTILCANCFNKSHKNFVFFKTHKLEPIDSSHQQSNNCKIHKEKMLEYYCHDCSIPICMDCLMIGGDKSCKNHNVVPIQEVNENFLEDLNDTAPMLDEMYRRLTKTAVDIGYLLLNYENNTGSATDLINIISSIDQHFSKLFSSIQKHKENIIKLILNLKCSEKESLEKAKVEVINAIKKAKSTLEAINMIEDPQRCKQVNLAILLDDAKQLVNTPWYLNKDDSNKESLKITVNEDLCSLIDDYVHLEGNVKSVYKLYSTTELGDDIKIPPPPNAPVHPPELPKDVRETFKPKPEKVLYKTAPSYHNKSGSVSSLNSIGSESSCKSYLTINDNYQAPLVQSVSPFAESQKPQVLVEGSQELIYVSHIVDPHNFFVQRACHQGLVKEMLHEFRNAAKMTKPSTNHIAPGKTYLGFNETDNMWQRCRVIGRDTSKNSKEPQIQVFYFDFGSTGFVSIDKLRLIPASRIQSPYPLALNCSLANCVPKKGAWTSDDSILILNIIDNKQAVIHIRRIKHISNVDFKYECDVTTFDHGVSLAHALVFHERAIMPNPKMKYPLLTGLKEKPTLYMSHNDFKYDTTEAVYLTHVVNPDKFFVRKQHLQSVYEKICEELDEEYSVASNAASVYLPEIGMSCVCRVQARRGGSGAWARGVVRALAGRGRVRVQLADSGELLQLPWSALRRILPKFTAIRALATECHLAGVTPLNRMWSTGSVKLLKNYEGRLLELTVDNNRERANQARGSLGVVLYDNSDMENVVCLNQEIIKHKYAVPFGVYKFNKKPVEEDQVVSKRLPSTTTEKRIAKQSNNITILKKQSEKKVDEVDLQAKDKGPVRLEVKVLSYHSPSQIYISLIHQQKTFNELFDKIQDYYFKNNDNSTAPKWKVGDNCCTICQQSQTWRRACIIARENENAQVFFVDFACIETVPLTGLRVLTSEFAAFGNAAILCHLYGIVPAVGEEWPSLTKEYLKELIDHYKRLFITRVGNFKGKSMPVELWAYHTEQGQALEPNKSEWLCLNKRVIAQGLAVPDKSQTVTTSESNEADRDDILSFLNITGSINEWLQLDPVPMVFGKAKNIDKADSASTLTENEGVNIGNESELCNVAHISDWLPPEPLTCNEFTGMPTYIDNDGVIYLHNITQRDTLDIIRKALDMRFKAPDPKTKYNKWTVGEPCVALFFLDNKYYRGKIVEVNKENSTCLIHYVDFGNEELCDFSNIRKSVPLHQIPIQSYKCILSGIRPIGKKWDQQTLDYIHKLIVEKECKIKVVGVSVKGVIPIELQIGKLLINEHLVDFEMAAPTSQMENKVAETIINVDSEPDYIIVDESDSVKSDSPSDDNILDLNSMKGTDWNKMMEDDGQSIDGNFVTYSKFDEDEFMCNITVINDVHTLELCVNSDDETSRVYDLMFEELQTLSHNLPPLDGIFENKACVAIFPEDGQWYRASILQFSEAKNQLKVRYVDYGNIEIISLADAREIIEEWTKLPPLTITAKLYGVKVNPDLDIKIITEEYAKIFLEKEPFHAKVITYENSIPLIELRNNKNELISNKLMESKVLVTANS